MNFLETTDFELLEFLLEEEGINREEDKFLIKKRALTETPASFQQRRLWFLHELEPTSSAYNICSIFRLDGSLQIEALQQAFRQLQQRHESLRTTFTAIDGEPWQQIHPNILADLIFEDWSDIAEAEIEKQISAVASSETQYSFNLEKGPLIRTKLLRLTPEQYVLALTLHHIIADGWSLGVIVEELASLYHLAIKGDVTALGELNIQYADYAVWQQEKINNLVLDEQLAYWEKQLKNLPVLQFPTDFPRLRLQSFKGDLVSFSIPVSLTRTIRNFSHQEDATLFMTLMAAFGVLLGRYCGQEDIPVGTSIANRPGIDAEKLIGFFVNMLVIRADLSGEPSFRTLLKKVKETILESFEHSEVPFEALVDRLDVERNTSINPLFQIAFTLLNAPKPHFQAGNLTVTPIKSQDAARFDLELFISESENNLSGVFSYNTDLFTRETVEQIARHFCNLLENLVTQPDVPITQLAILSNEEYAQLMPVNPPESFPVEFCLHEVFSQQAALRTNKTALIFENQSLTYTELNQRSNRLAHYLIRLGVKPESRVGLWMSRSLDLMVAILAVLKAGGTYVPFDPDYPAERVAYMLEDSMVSVLLTQVEFETQLPKHQADLVFIDNCEAELAQEQATNPEVNLRYDVSNQSHILLTFLLGNYASFSHTRMTLQKPLNFTQFDPKTAYFNLVVVTPQIFDFSVVQISR